MTKKADKVRVHPVIRRNTYNIIKETGYTVSELIEYATGELLLPKLEEKEERLKKELDELLRQKEVCNRKIEFLEYALELERILEEVGEDDK